MEKSRAFFLSQNGSVLLVVLILQGVMIAIFSAIYAQQIDGLKFQKRTHNMRDMDALLTTVTLATRSTTTCVESFLNSSGQPVQFQSGGATEVDTIRFGTQSFSLSQANSVHATRIALMDMQAAPLRTTIEGIEYDYKLVTLRIEARHSAATAGQAPLIRNLPMGVYVDVDNNTVKFCDQTGPMDPSGGGWIEKVCNSIGGRYDVAEPTRKCKDMPGTTGGTFVLGWQDSFGMGNLVGVAGYEFVGLVSNPTSLAGIHPGGIFCMLKNTYSNTCLCPPGYWPFMTFDTPLSGGRWTASFICRGASL